MTKVFTNARARGSLVPLIWAVLVIGGLPALTRAQAPQPTAQAPVTGAIPPGGFVYLVTGLKATPGCLGVETATTRSGKQVIFAWFEDKQALRRWYDSDTHQQAMAMFFPNRPAREPLVDVPEDSGPILAIASVKLAETPAAGGLPFAQIAIELYRPLSGGIAVGGKFAPDGLKVPGLREIVVPSSK